MQCFRNQLSQFSQCIYVIGLYIHYIIGNFLLWRQRQLAHLCSWNVSEGADTDIQDTVVEQMEVIFINVCLFQWVKFILYQHCSGDSNSYYGNLLAL